MSLRREKERKREEWGLVLDVYESSESPIHRKLRGKVAQILGEKYFTLLEVLLKDGVEVEELERVYIGPGIREKVATILRRVDFEELTSFAKGILERGIQRAIEENEERWVRFFNISGPLTPKLHSLELLPGVGKKKMWKIVQEREKKPFSSFKDIEERAGIDPVRALVKRALEELTSREEKYRIIVL